MSAPRPASQACRPALGIIHKLLSLARLANPATGTIENLNKCPPILCKEGPRLHLHPPRGWNVPRPLPSERWTTGMSNLTSLTDKNPDHLLSKPTAYTDNTHLPARVAPRTHQ